MSESLVNSLVVVQVKTTTQIAAALRGNLGPGKNFEDTAIYVNYLFAIQCMSHKLFSSSSPSISFADVTLTGLPCLFGISCAQSSWYSLRCLRLTSSNAPF